MKYIPDSVTRSIGKQILLTKKNSPHYFFVGGLIGIVTATVLACKATLKLEETLDEIHNDLDNVKELSHSATDTDGNAYLDKNRHKDLSYVYTKSGVKLVRLYGPAVALGGVSLAALTGSHVQMTRRNTALTVTLAALSKAYDEYRIRVQEELGKDKELDIHRNITNEEHTIDGKKQIVKVTDPNGWSIYARLFDEANLNWQKNSEMNRIFIQCQMNYANDLLRARGHVFLNDVYDSLGLERSRAGAVVGWVIGGDGDNFIDFGLFEACSADFMNGRERNIWLDFNVDGVVYDKI